MGTRGTAVAARKIPLPTPSGVFLKVMSTTGSIRTEYPSIVLSYLDTSHVPDPEFLTSVQAFASNFEASPEVHSEFELVAYAAPREELLDFSDGYFLNCQVPTQKSNDFFNKITKEGRYAILINTPVYSYRALIDDSTGDILEAAVEYRSLH